ncbi:aa3-type cytochrome c oxidase subunit IV [Candidatus Phycosocius spiralis]|uniref:Cytochrome c oxidase subunit IV bacterial aa3 type domain-containing protein n=1 Tax=Candidatus Phycosocius spiralis TaxID=2815099 RepID=A0ABQ4PWD2_9PROT|nr:aa3-type cytochrome c oxidase subunit IV [Candidatus Phycosocius spiralis]GIU67235.1 hypothetical protein PsB1_1389 [Candidatus Phycosocius spiralis]
MASHKNDYTHGKMDISAQSGMYQSFLIATQWGCVLISAMIACMALIWGAQVPWLQSVLGCGAFSIAAGLGMKMGPSFTITSVVLTVIGLGAGGISTLVSILA